MNIKVISLWQPWASLIALNLKEIETRSWKTNYRGSLAIHAAKKIVPQEQIFGRNLSGYVLEQICEAYGNYNMMPTGAIIATTNLINCQKIDRINGTTFLVESEKPILGREFYLGDCTPGRYGWVLSDTEALKNPIPAKGQQGLWNFDLPEGM